MTRWWVAVAMAGVLGAPAIAVGGVDPGVATAPRMDFIPPGAGTYTLQRIQRVAEATLLAPNGAPTRLSTLTTGRITLLTFFYTYCADPLGCPFAYQTLTNLRQRLLQNGALAGRVRFVNISLDPSNDKPEAIGRYRDMVTRNSTFEWDFLTSRSVRDLLPVLSDFGQDVSVEQAADGVPRRTIHHMLKVFLLDRSGVVREIYTLAYLQPAVIENDIQTLFLEETARAPSALPPATAESSKLAAGRR